MHVYFENITQLARPCTMR